MRPRLPFLTEIAPIPGDIKAKLEDFQVEEIAAYLPSGAGDHLYVRFEKRDLGTPEAVRRIARAIGVDPRATGYAGLKDKRAVTTQWASFERGDAERARSAAVEGVRILEVSRHGNKLRTGHLRGNRFVIVVRGFPLDRLSDARHVLDQLVERGAPNGFGPQRYGREGANLDVATRWLVEGGRPPRTPFERKLLVSVLQSALFDQVLAERIEEGLYGEPVDGDLFRKEDTGGLFTTDDLDDARTRMGAFAISPTGPMFGAKMRWPEREARRREERVLATSGLDEAKLRAFASWGEGTRRPLRIALRDAGITPLEDGSGARVAFELPKGAYATVVLREMLHREEDWPELAPDPSVF